VAKLFNARFEIEVSTSREMVATAINIDIFNFRVITSIRTGSYNGHIKMQFEPERGYFSLPYFDIFSMIPQHNSPLFTSLAMNLNLKFVLIILLSISEISPQVVNPFIHTTNICHRLVFSRGVC
jgi:hypothetical protein